MATLSHRGTQKTFGIDFAPAAMRERGLTEAHTHPLVSMGKICEPYRSRRVPARDAWRWAEVEHRTPNSHPVLTVDLDGVDATERLHAACFEGRAPWPNWIVKRPASGGIHAFWVLRRAVLYGPRARRRPLAAYVRSAEWLTLTLGGDPGFNGVLCHNAVYPGDELVTDWLCDNPYTLGVLGACVPKDWKRPPRIELRSAAGRNCALFDAGMRFAGSRKRIGMRVEPVLQSLNGEFEHPLPGSEVVTIATSVERYRARWEFYQHSAEEQSARGRRSGEARRKRTAERDERIMARLSAGASTVSVAAEFGLTQPRIVQIRKRERERV